MKKRFFGFVMCLCVVAATLLLQACGTPDPSEQNDAADFGAYFYDAESWAVLRGASGQAPVSLNDGSIKFYNVNHYVEIAETENKLSFMLKALGNWEIRFLASGNSDGGSYISLQKTDDGMYLKASTGGMAEFVPSENGYKAGIWTRFDIQFSQNETEIELEVFINREKSALVEMDENASITIEDGKFILQKPDSFYTGSYFIVKVWDNESVDYLQLKPVAKQNVADTLRVACIGDSITEGGGREAYPLQLQKLLGSAYNVVNFGKSGRTLLKNGDMPYWENYCFHAAKLFVPDIMIVMLGSNDAKTEQPLTQEAFQTDLIALIDVFKELNGDVRVIVNTSPKAHQFMYQISDANIKDKVVPAQKAVAEECGYELIDIYTWTENKANLFYDGIHPVDKGHELLAKLAYYQIIGEEIPQDFGEGY